MIHNSKTEGYYMPTHCELDKCPFHYVICRDCCLQSSVEVNNRLALNARIHAYVKSKYR